MWSFSIVVIVPLFNYNLGHIEVIGDFLILAIQIAGADAILMLLNHPTKTQQIRSAGLNAVVELYMERSAKPIVKRI